MKPNIFKNQFFIFLCALSTSLWVPKNATAQLPVFDASVTDECSFSNMPSASGIVKFEDNFYVVGDDSPYLFQLDSEFKLTKTIQISSAKHLQNGRIPKKYKPDFECMTIVPWGNDNDLLVFGSGDKKEREVLVRVDIDEGREKIESYSLKKFYKLLAKKTKGNGELNIEGAGYWNNYLILLNRADNTLFKIDLDDFKDYMRDKDNDKPKIESVQFILPSINGISSRFSGATVMPDEDLIIFTASVENDPNWIIKDDIVCSYLGIIDLNQLDNNEPICKLIMKDNKPVQEKVESIYVIDKDKTSIKLTGVIDNDNGGSKLIKIEFKKNIRTE